MTNLILPRRRKLLVPSFAAGLAAASPAMGHNGGPPLATDAEVTQVVEKAKGAGLHLPWGTFPSDPSLAMFMMAKMSGMLSSGADAGPSVSTVFATSVYTGNATSRTITTGLDLAGSGGLVWTKDRTAGQVGILQDTVRGVGNTKQLTSSGTNSQTGFFGSSVSAFGSTGYDIDTQSGGSGFNASGNNYVSWNFKRSLGFFDIVTYTGNGANRTISHNLGSVPGMIIVKRISVAGSDWAVQHRNVAASDVLFLNTASGSAANANYFNSTYPTSSVFSLGTDSAANASGEIYIAYLFGHDTTPSGFIQCGSFTTASNGSATVTGLPWSPQFLLVKLATTTGAWIMLDTSRGWGAGSDKVLIANSSGAEQTFDSGAPTSDGFTVPAGGLAIDAQTLIYMAIRA